MKYDTAKLHQFINEHFGPQDLNDLLFDYFRSVHEDLTPEMTKRQHILLLLEFCTRQGKFPDLLAAIERERSFFQPDDYVQGEKAPTTAPQSPTPVVTRNPRQIFISHAHQDVEVAQRLADDLEAEGYAIWMAPDSIWPGEKWAEAIGRGLDSSGLFLLLMSPEAVVSRWVNTETNIAIKLNHEGGMQLYPLLLRACRVPTLWRAYQRISLRGGYETGLSQLLAALDPEFTTKARQTNFGQVFPPTVTQGKPPAKEVQDSFIDQKTGKAFVRVPAGEFLFGDEKKKMYLDEFWMAKTPVTNAEYARFVAEMKVQPPKHWKGNTSPAELADHPVVYVSWHDAKAYAEWAGLELPTEEQWEKAARGTDGREYPWGNDWRENHCNTHETGIGKTSPVGKFSPQGDSVYGCVDMAGNVWDWTDSLYSKGSDWRWRVVRGGSWSSNQSFARAAYRNLNLPAARLNFGWC